jgi:RND superfamily putative drug exporter
MATALVQKIDEFKGVRSVSPPQQVSPGVLLFEVQSHLSRESSEAVALVRRIRSLSGPFDVLVSGTAAEIEDREHSISVRVLPVLAASVAGIAFVLFIMAASIAIPVKLILLCAGTISATFGVVALLFDTSSSAAGQAVFDSTQILTLAVLGAALVTDYGVFVAARIVRGHTLGLEDEEAIAAGLASTGPIVSTAALVFTVAVGSFLPSNITLVQQLCAGLMAAVLIDAMLVRAFLVPALMKSLGPYNWWLPGWAARLHRWLT